MIMKNATRKVLENVFFVSRTKNKSGKCFNAWRYDSIKIYA